MVVKTASQKSQTNTAGRSGADRSRPLRRQTDRHELRPERPQRSQKSQLRVSQAPSQIAEDSAAVGPATSLPAPDAKIEDRPQTAAGKSTEMTVQHAGDRMDDAPRHKNFLLKLVQNRISLGTDRSPDLETPMILPADGVDRAGDKTWEVARVSQQRSNFLRFSQAQCQRRS